MLLCAVVQKLQISCLCKRTGTRRCRANPRNFKTNRFF